MKSSFNTGDTRFIASTDKLVPMRTRERALKAAVTVVATKGFQALTHASVDAEAELPAGSTSNYFRTKSALISGLIEHISAPEQRSVPEVFAPETPEELVDKVSALVIELTTNRREYTAARLAIFLSGNHRAEIREGFAVGGASFRAAVKACFERFGAEDPGLASDAIVACAEGIIYRQIVWGFDIDPRGQLGLIAKGALASS
ncbi:hypothetical protein BHE16_06335 [Neomicrococcus aestuarii]|uniref:HTH tetR-type domain-containing protein n=2 Tax=Neomicrococcus aestuarii TaxID=556325 RepID=A0A1L2ZNT2_9MICC|nr:hypothetical protein BHE16_06335 [Neomicrococcus aestuarii]